MIDLKSILTHHPNCLSSRSSFKSVLMDKYPSEKRTVNILTILFECGVANKIKLKKRIDANEMQGLIVQIENEYGISAQYAQEAILIWASAFDVSAEKFNLCASSPTTPLDKNRQAVAPLANTDSAYTPIQEQQATYSTTGNSSDYNIVMKNGGYYISRFKGFEEEEMIIPNEIDEKKIVGVCSEAFQGCVSVKKICLSEGIRILENGAFSECSSLTEVILPTTLTTIGSPTQECKEGVFAATKIERIVIPDSVTYMGPYTFWYCHKLKEVKLSNNLEAIEIALFLSCSDLESVRLPQRLKTIKTAAFNGCNKLKTVHIPNGTKVIEENAFKGAGISSIYVPPSVTSIASTTSAPNWFTRRSWGPDETLGGYGTVYCEAGSAAFDFARKNNMKCAKAQF